ncbi:hypothetical protein SAMN05216480_101589 [Pustulibacterium marinum]|uniref:Lipoprotein n=1 Tax=Pustulibacterium marinum TaxID=1224947 RepID=A0A1I7F3A4_9FLAO|nr:hypothetical protein [Pustulibacterium marinum]SFU30652.1 hypothetical protein SAMN05216480_101589 [Pustulibacterium marinum]
MKKLVIALMALSLSTGSLVSCRDSKEKKKQELIDEMKEEGADIKMKKDGDEEKIKMETENKEVKIKEDDDGDMKIKTDDN